MHVGSMVRGFVVAGLSILFCAALASFAASATSPEITVDQQKTCEYFGFPSTMCRPADIAILQGGCEFNPYPILERYKSDRSVQITPRGDGDKLNLSGGINPSLACRLVKFFEYAEKTQGCRNIKIISAYRSAQQQENLCGSGRTGCAPAGRSCHQYGLAIDISSSCTSWMRSFLGDVEKGRTAGAQQFQLHFPYSGDHIQCAENVAASCNPNTRGCDGKIGITPDLNFVSRPSPTTAFTNAIRQALGMSTQQPVVAQPATPSQLISSSQSPLQAFEPTSTTGVSTQIDTIGETTHATSVADLLEELAFGRQPPSTQTATGTTVPLVVSGSEAVGIVSTQPVGQQNLPPGVSGISEQTFISGDLSWQGGAVQPTQPLTGWDAIIATIKATLTRMMQLLTPFGAREQIYIDEHGEFHSLE